MAFDFPASPSEGTTFAPSGGPVYVYTGGVWRMQGSGQAVTAEARNRIVNPAMQVNQERDTAAVGPFGTFSWYAVDQWITDVATNPGTVSGQWVQVVTPNGSKNRIRATVAVAKAALAASDYLQFQQRIEGIRLSDFRYGTAAAKQSVLRFGFKGPAGTYSASIVNGPTANRSYIANFTIAAGQANADTEQVFVIPGDTSGTWGTDTGRGMSLAITLATGTTWQGAAGWQGGVIYGSAANTNGLLTVGNTFELFDVGLYLDPNNTGVPPPWQMPDEAQELAACMRYWVSLYAYVPLAADTYTMTFPSPLRAGAAVSGGGAGFNVVTAGPNTIAFRQTTAGWQTMICNARM